MNQFFTKHAGKIILIVISLSVGGFSDSILDRVLPNPSAITKEVLREIIIEVVQEENAEQKEDIRIIKEQYSVLADGAFEEWERVIRKQYLKVQTNRDDLSWSDVEYGLSKWDILPDSWQTPELCSMVEYLKEKYNDHIKNGS